MEQIIDLHRRVAPELISLLEDRYRILRQVQYAQPVGRRALAASLGLGERIVRAQIDFLREAGLLGLSSMGVTITPEGQLLLKDLAEYIKQLHGFSAIEEQLAAALGLRRVMVIRGDSGADPAVRRELGRAAALVLAEYLKPGMTVAVSGGSTLATMAESVSLTVPDVTVVPARGGLGEKMEYQANTIAAVMATKLGGRYRLLHVPDGVSEETVEVILAADSNVRSVADSIRHADIVVHGIGRADAMTTRRGGSPEMVAEIIGHGGVGEALGQYCALDGSVVYVTGTLGFRLEDLSATNVSIAVAGGSAKAEAIVAVARAGGQTVLVIDEAAAKAIQTIVKQI